MAWMDVVPIAISALSVLFAFSAYWGQRRLQSRVYSRLGSEFLAQTVLGLDRMLIDEPALWEIYDERKGESREMLRLRAVAMYYFNMFQMAYDLYHDSKLISDRRAKRLWASWEVWMSGFFSSSSIGRAYWEESRASYDESFRAYVDRLAIAKRGS